MAYSSKIDLGGLGEAPTTTDPANYKDFVEVYNAIHILAQWIGALEESMRNDGDSSDQANWLNYPISKFWWGTAARPITKGQICGNVDVMVGYYAQQREHVKGVVPGLALYYHRTKLTVPTGSTGGDQDSTIYGNFYLNRVYPVGISGIAMNDAAPGERVRIAVGEGIVELAGAKAGTKILAMAGVRTPDPALGESNNFEYLLVNDGRIFAETAIPFVNNLVQIGVGTGDNEALIWGSHSYNFALPAWGDR